MKVLGISAFYHDSAAALVVDGRIVAAAQEERFSRKKHDAGFPMEALRCCLEEAALTINEVDAIAFYDKPLLKFERLLETHYAVAPFGYRAFVRGMPVWLKEKLFLKDVLRRHLKELAADRRIAAKLLFPEHHLSHAASAFFASPFEEAAILTIDGVGEWATATIAHGKGNAITVHRELRFPHSAGLLYSAFTHWLGFRVNDGEYKVMGLAPYGRAGSVEVAGFERIIREQLVRIHEDGSMDMRMNLFAYLRGERMVDDAKWERLFGFTRRRADDPLEQHHCDLALAIQIVIEDIVLRMVREAKRITGSEQLCMAGGVALNCTANGKLLDAGIFREVFVQPAAGDAGGAIGAALAAYHIHSERDRTRVAPDAMSGARLGSLITEKEVDALPPAPGVEKMRFDRFEELAERTAGLLAAGKVVGWAEGRMEFGPRALGGRSILADPRDPHMQQRLNEKIKFREGFRPFAPAVLAEDAEHWFAMNGAASPCMLFTRLLRSAHRKQLPPRYDALPMREKLAVERSTLPAITHVDFSARVQTVHADSDPRFHALLSAFKRLTGVGVLVNTSFNVKDEPIVRTAADAHRCFLATGMDALVIGDTLFTKRGGAPTL